MQICIGLLLIIYLNKDSKTQTQANIHSQFLLYSNK